jgi:hypothetical protein
MNVRINLTAEDGSPIGTEGYDGHIEIGDETVDTNASGIATVTVPRAPQQIEYSPSSFVSRSSEAYAASSTSVNPGASVTGLVAPLFYIGFALWILFLPLYMFDRMFDWGVWPPWEVYL